MEQYEHIFEDRGSVSLDSCVYCGETLADACQDGRNFCEARALGEPPLAIAHDE